ncbi:MAG: hypothetical protein UU26_C0008G0031 [Candidatus Daviesbacteria bacterium GW2011_GWC1_40_9]|nr:MAG: hypothetical protein UU26_C0008G0031 [Candidatus Daviesbacteria bacterium GW2011_GWC1_40_9]
MWVLVLLLLIDTSAGPWRKICTDGDTTCIAGSSGGYWTLSGNNLYPTTIGNNVGIGTTAPGAALDVRNAISVGTAGATEGTITLQTTGGGETAPYIVASTGNLDLYTPTGWIDLYPVNGIKIGGGANLWWIGNSGNATFDFYNAANTAVTIKNTGGGVANLIVDGGNVGIGTVTPYNKLDVALYGYLGGRLGTNQSGTKVTALAWNSSGNVGIGTTGPTQKLDVAGYVKGQSGLCMNNDCRSTWPGGGVRTETGKYTTPLQDPWTRSITRVYFSTPFTNPPAVVTNLAIEGTSTWYYGNSSANKATTTYVDISAWHNDDASGAKQLTVNWVAVGN